jgi:hypothetical protein
VDALVKLDKRTGLKNLHVVDAPMPPPGPAPPPYWSAAILDLVGVPKGESSLTFELLGGPSTTLGFFLPLGTPPLDLRSAPPTSAQLDAARLALGERLAAFDTKRLYIAAATPPFIPADGSRLALVFGATLGTERVPPRFHLMQMLGRELLGGSTFVLVAREDGIPPRAGDAGSAG